MPWRRWSADEDDLVRALPPAEAARRTGRTLMAVRCRRRTLRCGRRNRRWTAAEDELARALPPAEAARQTGRTVDSVYVRRRQLGVAVPKDGRTAGYVVHPCKEPGPSPNT